MSKSLFMPAAIALAALSSSPALAAGQPGGDAPATAQPTAPAPQDPAASAPSSAPASPSAIVNREFPSYDLDKDGQLSEAEFSAWVVKLRKPAADGAAPTDSQSWSASLFARADTDHNQSVSKTEMTTLLAAAARG